MLTDSQRLAYSNKLRIAAATGRSDAIDRIVTELLELDTKDDSAAGPTPNAESVSGSSSGAVGGDSVSVEKP